jgi:trk system potassium uptake protein TrkA
VTVGQEYPGVAGPQENDVVVVSFGEDLAASTLITLHLKQMKIRDIIVKAPNVEYKQVLESVGATEVIIPEKEMASKVARSLISPNILDYIPLAADYIIGEIAPPASFQGKTLADVHLRSKHNINVIAIRDTLTDTVRMVPPNYVIKDSEILIVIANPGISTGYNEPCGDV